MIIPHPRPSPATELSAPGQAARAGEGRRAAPNESALNGSLSPGERVAKGRERGRVAAGKDGRIKRRPNQTARARRDRRSPKRACKARSIQPRPKAWVTAGR